MFAVDDIDDVVARLRKHGAELVGEMAQYEDMYRLCFIRAAEGFIVGLAEQLDKAAERADPMSRGRDKRCRIGSPARPEKWAPPAHARIDVLGDFVCLRPEPPGAIE